MQNRSRIIVAWVVFGIGALLFGQQPGRTLVSLSGREAPRVASAADAKALLLDHAGELGIAGAELSDAETKESAASGRVLRAHHFRQIVGGIGVEDSDLVVLTDGQGEVRLVEATVATAARGVPPVRVDRAAAADAVIAALRGGDPVAEANLVVSLVGRCCGFGEARGSGVHFYWRVDVDAAGDAADGRSLVRSVYVDAESVDARVAAHFPRPCAGDTKNQYITNHLPPGDANATLAVEGQGNVDVMFFCAWGGVTGPVTSGANGAYAPPPGYLCIDPTYGPGVTNVLGMWGLPTFPDMDIWQGLGPLPSPGAGFGGAGTAPGSHPTSSSIMPPFAPEPDLVLDGLWNGASGAAGNAVHWQRKLREYCSLVPALLGGVRFTVEVDTPPFPAIACAVPMGGLWRVRFGGAGVLPGGATLANAASSTILVHEMGHIVWWNATAPALWNGHDTGAINEAVADTFAMFVTKQRFVGQDAYGPMTGALRDGLNGRQYATFDPAGEVHAQGEILMGSFWAMRQNLVATLGGPQGESFAQALLLDWLALFDDVDLDSRIMAHLLVLDDDDANLANGTPHLAAIVGGFQSHGLPASDPALFAIGTDPILGAVFFDPQPSPAVPPAIPAGIRSSRLSVFLLAPSGGAGLPVVALAGAAGATPIAGLGVVAIDLAMPYYFLIDGVGGAGMFPVFPAATDALGMFDLRQDVTAFWALPPGIPFAVQAAVVDATAPSGLRLSNGITLLTP